MISEIERTSGGDKQTEASLKTKQASEDGTCIFSQISLWNRMRCMLVY